MTFTTTRADMEPSTPADAVAAAVENLFRQRSDLRFSVTLDLAVTHPRALEIVHLKTLNKGRGHAGCVLDCITEEADHQGVTLRLRARAIPERGRYLAQRDLESFYERRGFRVTSRWDGNADMRRLRMEPRSHCVPDHPRTINGGCSPDARRSSSTY